MNPFKFYNALERGARIGFAVGALAIVLLTAGMLWWALSPREQLLFGGLKETDAAEISKALDEWKVPHSFTDGGSGISVPEGQLYETRMRLVSAGIPRGGHVGFELFDDSDFGVTEFAQHVNYQRALQGEIERTISALPAVESARVHLTIRRPGLFVGDQESSKASVTLSLRPGETLAAQQLRGIRSLVASAVEGLDINRVSVIDSSGALLAAGAVGSSQSFMARDDEESQVESRIQARITDLLHKVLRDDQFQVSVDVALDFDAVKRVNEHPLSDGAVVVRHRVNSKSASDDGAARPNDEDTEYQHGTVREEIARAPGRIERLSVAVVLPTTLSDADVTRIQSLVAAAAGIDAMRGDRLEVTQIGRSPDAVVANQDEAGALPAGASANAAPLRIGDASAGWPVWTKIALFVVIGLLLGLTVAFAFQKKPAKLSPTEREAVLGKMRAWLAEGTLPQ